MKISEFTNAKPGHATADDFENYETVEQWWEATDRGFDMIYICLRVDIANTEIKNWVLVAEDIVKLLKEDGDVLHYLLAARTSDNARKAVSAAGMLAAFVSGAGAANNDIANIVRKHIAYPF